jgi:hypothetical protein
MREVAIVLVLVSLTCAALPGMVVLAQRRLPTTVAFGTFSLFFYYGIGLTLEIIGAPYTVPYFSPFRAVNSDRWLPACAILVIAPWLLILGGKMVRPSAPAGYLHGASSLDPQRRAAFYTVAFLSAALCVWVGINYMLSSPSIWTARATITADFGAFIIVLYLPLHLLAFTVVQRDAQGPRGLFTVVLLALAAVAGTLAIGQRTNALLPVLVIVLFRGRPSLAKPLIGGVLLFWGATALLPAFKSADLYGSKSTSELIAAGLDGDVVRGPILLDALARSALVGTRIMPFPMSGYWYSLQFFVPRSIAIAKGLPTASYFTGAVMDREPEELTWGFGVGFIEEVALNAGTLAIIPGMLLYGSALGILDRMSSRRPALVPATRLAALWMAGYHLPALLLTFGAMAIVALVCGACFTACNLAATNPATAEL